MLRQETKRLLILPIILSLVFTTQIVFATDYSSTNFIVKDPVVDNAGNSGSSTNYGLGQSLGQTAIGKSTSTNFQLWSGFQYYFKVNSNVLTATPGNGQVELGWTVPSTFLGISISSYEVGVGTVSGSYVFTDRGNVTSWTQTGLTNGTQYFFKIKAKSAGGLFLVFSNEATATPTSPTPPPTPPGGGGGGNPPPPPPISGATIVLNGLASPGASVTVLRDGSVAAVTTADPGAGFNVTITGLTTGIYSFSVYATDTGGIKSPTLSFFQSLTSGIITTVDNLFLGPTIGLSHSVIKQGENINIFGYTTPSSDVSVFVNSHQQFIEKLTSTGNGSYFKAFNTIVLELGGHSSSSQTAKDNKISNYSNTISFQVSDKSVAIDPGACGRSDLNCDGHVNLTDFSILLFFWNQSNPSNAKADINTSGIVDLTDFSIMLFDWTG